MESILEEILLIDDGSVLAHAPVEDFKQQLIVLNGPSDVLATLLADKVIYAQKDMAGMTLAVVEASSLVISEDLLRTNGITKSPLTSSDVCMYLTRKKRT